MTIATPRTMDSRLRLLPWGIAAAGLAFHVWAMWGGFFHMDDFFYLTDAQGGPWSYVSQIYNGHLMPLGFLVVWVSQAVAPMSWPLAVLVCTVLWAAMLSGAIVTMQRAFGSIPWTSLVVALLAFAPLLTTVSVWYASALQVLPWGATLVWMLYFAIRDAQQPRLVWAFSGVGVYMIGLLFWQKAILVLPVVLWIAWRYWPGTGRWGLRGMGQRWVLPGLSVVLTVGYVAMYLRMQSEDILRSNPSVGQLLESIRISLGEVWLPGYFGAPWTGFGEGLTPGSPSSWWAIALVWQVVAAIVVVSVVRWRSAWNAWLILAAYAAITVVLFAFGRINEFGLALAYDPRYVEDLFIVGTVVLPFAFLRPRGSSLPAPRHMPWLVTGERRPLLLLGAIVLANLLVLPSIAVGSSWHDSEAKRYVETARAALLTDLDTPVLDRKVPPGVMAPLFLERANASYVLGGLRLPVRWDSPGARVLALGDDGQALSPVIAASSTSLPGSDGACGWRVFERPARIPMDSVLFDWVWVGTMNYLASGAGEARVKLGDTTVSLPIEEGPQEVTFVLVGGGDAVEVSPPEGVGLCIARILVGQVDYGEMQ